MGAFLSSFSPVFLAIHFMAAFFLISVILLQSGKGTDIGSMFGAGGSQSLFGARGAATLLTKLTTASAIIFLITSLSLATIANYMATGGSSVITKSEGVSETSADLEAAPATDPIPTEATTDKTAEPVQDSAPQPE